MPNRRDELRGFVVTGLHIFGYACWVLAVITLLFMVPIWGELLGECRDQYYSCSDFIEYKNPGTIVLAAILSSLSCAGVGFLFLGIGMTLKQVDKWASGKS